jgi:hypothetical protein
MEIEEVLTVVKNLAEGHDPQPHQPFPSDVPWNDQNIATPLRAAAGIIENARDREQRKGAQPANSGKYWSQAEEERVCDELKKGMNFHEIGALHNRSVGSIVARLVKLGKIAPKQPIAKAS